MQVIVDSILTNWQACGQGKNILLVHGWGDSSKTFSGLAAELSKKYRTICLDLPGFGASSAPDTSWGLEDYAQYIEHFIKKVNLGDIYAFVGHSNGGAILIKGLSRGYLKSEKLILLASAGVRSEDKTKKKLLNLVAKVSKIVISPLPAKTKNKIKKAAYDSMGSDLFVAEHMQDTFKKVIASDVVDDAKQVSQPTLLVYGTKDTATPVHYGELLVAAIPGSRLEVLDGCGHFVHQEQTSRVTSLIEEFLNA
jgi:pimeloyl-ACP methyl ester carboxylesterase